MIATITAVARAAAAVLPMTLLSLGLVFVVAVAVLRPTPDRLAMVIVPGTRDVQASFAPVAKHYGAIVEPCPPRRGNRKVCATDCTSSWDG